jgi:hypothetical protein
VWAAEIVAAGAGGVDGSAAVVLDPGMTGDQLGALLKLAEATKADDGWSSLGQHTLTLHTAFNGAALSLARIESVKVAGSLLLAKSSRGEIHVVIMDNLFGGSIEPSRETGRKAGFV